MNDELRYSHVEAAADSLKSLGELYTGEIVTADPEGKVQLIIVGQHFDDANSQDMPKSMRWTPFNIFEGQHFQRFVPQVQNSLCVGRQVLAKALDDQYQLERRHLQNNLRGSNALRGSIALGAALGGVALLAGIGLARPQARLLLTLEL